MKQKKNTKYLDLARVYVCLYILDMQNHTNLHDRNFYFNIYNII